MVCRICALFYELSNNFPVVGKSILVLDPTIKVCLCVCACKEPKVMRIPYEYVAPDMMTNKVHDTYDGLTRHMWACSCTACVRVRHTWYELG